MIDGWLLDCYPALDNGQGMTFWIKLRNGSSIRLKDSNWRAKIYADGAACDNPEFIFSKLKDSGFVFSVRVVRKRASIFEQRKSKVLEIELCRPDKGKKAADLLEATFQNPSMFRLYNVDLSAEQQYFLEKGLFPLGRVKVYSQGEQITRWSLLGDDVSATDYEIPPLRVMGLELGLDDKVPRFDSKLVSVTLTPSNYHEEEENTIKSKKIAIEGRNEIDMLRQLEVEILKFDPDFVITSNGDAFIFPYLYSKACKYSIPFNMGRDLEEKEKEASCALNRRKAFQSGGKTYFSYGRIMFRPATQRLYGRIHVDGQNTFVYDQCRFEGLFEIARISRMPFHTSARASIGKSLSGLQFYHAYKRDMLIPYKPVESEEIKSMESLLVADRGGLVFVPLPGIHERVCELDFASMYPSIIRQRNISAETVNCPCCPGSPNVVEELGMHICTKKIGLVPESLELPLNKRFEYKRLLRDETTNEMRKQAYNERASALKWVLVTSFGYLSFRHAKFMKIDAHIAVCAIARETLLTAMHTAEGRGCRVIHGIIDSIWLSKDRAKLEDYQEICEEIEKATGFKLAIEGVYKWIVFLPSKVDSQNQVANRYFGCFEKNNEIKVRGIEYRRHDAPLYFKKCQEEILTELAKCDSAHELKKVAREEGVRIFNEYAERLERHDVPSLELLITRRLSKNPGEYFSKRQLSVNAAVKLEEQGLELRAGQSISYLITKYKTAGMKRAVPEHLAEDAEYDSLRYTELLADCCATILSPFGVSKEELKSRTISLQTWV